jgi:alkylated DNA repair dioxygenase AlkB
MKSQPLGDKPILSELLNIVNDYLGTNFNGILVNHYVDGTKIVGSHGDNEDGLDKNNKMVAALSYGAIRKFRIRENPNTIILDIPTTPCSLIVMDGEFQSEFKHEIPPEKRIKEDRISLTFRSHTV